MKAAPALDTTSVTITGMLDQVGRSMVGIGATIISLIDMLGAVLAAGGRVMIRPSGFRLTSTVHHLEQVCWRAVPIVVLITFLIGCIISQQGIFHFRKFGADIFVVDMLGRAGAARNRRAAGGDHGGGPIGQRLHRRTRFHEDARGDRRPAHHGFRSDRGSGPADGCWR